MDSCACPFGPSQEQRNCLLRHSRSINSFRGPVLVVPAPHAMYSTSTPYPAQPPVVLLASFASSLPVVAAAARAETFFVYSALVNIYTLHLPASKNHGECTPSRLNAPHLPDDIPAISLQRSCFLARKTKSFGALIIRSCQSAARCEGSGRSSNPWRHLMPLVVAYRFVP